MSVRSEICSVLTIDCYYKYRMTGYCKVDEQTQLTDVINDTSSQLHMITQSLQIADCKSYIETVVVRRPS